MADAPYRYQQSRAGGQYFPHQNHQNYHHRQYARNGSPVNNGRGAYTNDTPSPSRSPVSQVSNPASFGMFNQGHQQGQHVMVNGGGHQNFLPMNMGGGHKYQHQSHQQHHGQQNHHHHHQQNPNGNHGGQIGHQYTFSSGTMSNATPHSTPAQMHNGIQNNNQQGVGEEVQNWPHQSNMLAEARQPVVPHRHAKKEGQVTLKGSQHKSTQESAVEGADERNRPFMGDEDSRQDWKALDLSGQGLRAMSDPLFDHYSFLTKLYLDNNLLTHISPSIGSLRKLTHLNLSNNQLILIPPEIGLLTDLVELSLVNNRLQQIPDQIGYLYKLDDLGIEGNMGMDESIRDFFEQHGTKALVERLRESIEAGPAPNPRQWITLDSTSAGETVSIVSHNTLCDKYATRSQYGYTPSRALSWDYRSKLILQEIQSHDADFVCLQEVDKESYDEFFQQKLIHNDYRGVFTSKSRAQTMTERDARLVDGCATFFKKSKYLKLGIHYIHFSGLAINRPDMKGQTAVFNRVMGKDNIAILAFFENRFTGTRVIVVNAHIYWHPDFSDVKLVQTAILMEQIDVWAEKWSRHPPCTDQEKSAFRYSESDGDMAAPTSELLPKPAPSLEYPSGPQIPLIICGDFNSGEGSGVYDLITQGSIRPDHKDFKGNLYGNLTRDGSSHNFTMKSAYTREEELEFTNYTANFRGIIDYIWYSANSLQVRGLLGDVDKDHVRTIPGFPNWHFPSDHLALKAEFEVKPRKDRK